MLAVTNGADAREQGGDQLPEKDSGDDQEYGRKRQPSQYKVAIEIICSRCALA